MQKKQVLPWSGLFSNRWVPWGCSCFVTALFCTVKRQKEGKSVCQEGVQLHLICDKGKPLTSQDMCGMLCLWCYHMSNTVITTEKDVSILFLKKIFFCPFRRETLSVWLPKLWEGFCPEWSTEDAPAAAHWGETICLLGERWGLKLCCLLIEIALLKVKVFAAFYF